MAVACAPSPADRLTDVPYSGDIAPTLARPAFALAPEPAPPPEMAMRATVSEPPAGIPAFPLPQPALAVDLRPSQDLQQAEAPPFDPPRPPPLSARRSEPAAVEAEPAAPERAARDLVVALRAPGMAERRSVFRLGDGADDLTAADWAGLADLARRQRIGGGMVRVMVERTGLDGESADSRLAGLETSMARARAMAAALARLGVDARRIAVTAIDRPAAAPAPASEPGATEAAATPRIVLDRAGAPG
jgi:hypothetical protein